MTCERFAVAADDMAAAVAAEAQSTWESIVKPHTCTYYKRITECLEES